MKQTIVTTALVSLLGVSSVFGEGTEIAVEADRISLFEVPLRCEAAPAIGCGSRSKPILLELEGEPIIMEAWLNGSGTVLAVVGSEGSSRESRNKAVQSVVEKNGQRLGNWTAKVVRPNYRVSFPAMPGTAALK